MTGRVRAWAWALAGGLALAFLGGLALHGERPEAGLGRFVAMGPMRAPTPEEAERVEVSVEARRWVFVKAADRRWQAADGAPLTDAVAGAIAQGLQLLHNTAIERRLTRDELAGVDRAPFGLDDGALRVMVQGAGQSFAVTFGAANPLGLARYARIGNDDEVVLIPSYVAATWEQAAGGQK